MNPRRFNEGQRRQIQSDLSRVDVQADVDDYNNHPERDPNKEAYINSNGEFAIRRISK